MLSLRTRFVSIGLLGALVAWLALGAACSKTVDKGVLQDLDLAQPDPDAGRTPFDRNNILDTGTFVDVDAEQLQSAAVQAFFLRSPYDDRGSFLSSYQSNGVRAADAVARAARTYRINPLVFLVEAQAAEGLIGEPGYPFPPERVEYVFRCGCLEGDTCLPALAGFDRQLDCLGRKLRASLDQLASGPEGTTVAGWKKDKASATLDRQKITPANDATAVIYDHRPRLAIGAPGGTWLFWNLLNIYAKKLKYELGGRDGLAGSGWIGDKCLSPASCGFEGAMCATTFPEGICTIPCTTECPSRVGRPPAFCADFTSPSGKKSACLIECNPGASGCRSGYVCQRLKRFGATSPTDGKFVCTKP